MHDVRSLCLGQSASQRVSDGAARIQAGRMHRMPTWGQSRRFRDLSLRSGRGGDHMPAGLEHGGAPDGPRIVSLAENGRY